jgi:dTMP kinase
MSDFATSVAELQKKHEEAVKRLAAELQKIDDKIRPVVERAEAAHPEDRLYGANLELKHAYIEQEKQAVVIQALIAIQQLISASLEAEVQRLAAEAAAAADAAASEKAQHAAEKKAAQDEADAQAKADNAKAQADADKAKADNDNDAAKAKAAAERDAAQQDAASDKRANDAKKNAALKKAEQDAVKALIAALEAAAATLKASASTIDEIKKKKDDLHQEITDGPARPHAP